MNFQEWKADLEARCEKHLKKLKPDTEIVPSRYVPVRDPNNACLFCGNHYLHRTGCPDAQTPVKGEST